MAATPWKIRSEMQPAFDGALLDNQYVKGGIFIKKTKALRNAIGVLYRKLSSDTTTLCYVENDNIIYKLVNNPATASTTDSDWEALSLSSSSLTPVGNWNANNTDPALTDAGAAGREGEFYFVTGAPTATDVTHAGLFGGLLTSVSDGMYVVSVGTAWIVVSNAATWDALSKPAAITDYVNGTVIEHEHTIAQVSGLSDALADKYDSSNTADHTIDFASVSDTAIIELEFLKTWYYSKTDIDSMIESTLAGNFWALEGITTLTEDATINANAFSLTFEGFTGGLFFNDTTGGGIFFNDTSAGGIFLDTAGGGVYIGDSAGGGVTIEDLAGGYVDLQSIGSTGGGIFLWAQDSSTAKYAMLDLNSDYVYLELVGDDSIEMAINGMGSFLIGTGNNVIATDVFSRYNFLAGYDTVVSGIAGAYVQWATVFGEAGTITSSKAGSTVNNPVILGGYFNAINLEATAAGVNQYASMYSPIIIGSQNVITNENSNGPLSNPMAIGYNLIVEGDLSLAMGYWGHILDDASGAFVHGFVTTIAQFGNHTGTVERVTAGGIHAVNISANSPSQVVGHGAYADYSAILGGIDHDIPDGSDRSVILGGNGIKARAADPDNAYVPYFNIMEIEQDDLLTQVLVRDETTGKIYWRSDSTLGSGGGGGGESITVSNGLTRTGDDIKLGGTSTEITTIELETYQFYIEGHEAGFRINEAGSGFEVEIKDDTPTQKKLYTSTDRGTLFSPTHDGSIYSSIKTGYNGYILIRGSFTTMNGESRKTVALVDYKGDNHSTFNTNLGTAENTGAVNNLVWDSVNDHYYIMGSFTSWNGTACPGLIRLDSTGVVDATFTAGFVNSHVVNCLAVAPDGSVYAGGTGVPGGIVKMSSTGVVDATFDVGTGVRNSSSQFDVRDIVVQSTGKVIVNGNIEFVNDVALAHLYVVRLNTDGSIDATFDANILDVGAPPTAIRVVDSAGSLGWFGISSWGADSTPVMITNADGVTDNDFKTNFLITAGDYSLGGFDVTEYVLDEAIFFTSKSGFIAVDLNGDLIWSAAGFSGSVLKSTYFTAGSKGYIFHSGGSVNYSLRAYDDGAAAELVFATLQTSFPLIYDSTVLNTYYATGDYFSDSFVPHKGYVDKNKLKAYTVATVPDVADWTNCMIMVTDESGGYVPAFSDGVNWRRVTDRAVIS